MDTYALYIEAESEEEAEQELASLIGTEPLPWTRESAQSEGRAQCRYCGRRIIEEGGRWIDPEATGDDAIWRETCDAHDTFTAEHEPAVESAQSERPSVFIVIRQADVGDVGVFGAFSDFGRATEVRDRKQAEDGDAYTSSVVEELLDPPNEALFEEDE